LSDKPVDGATVTPAALDYARDGRPTRRRRVIVVLLVLLALMLTMRVFVYPRVRPYYAQAWLLWQQRRFMNWTWPEDKVAYTDDEALRAKLEGNPAYRNQTLSFNQYSEAERVAPPDWPRPLVLSEVGKLPTDQGVYQISGLFRHRRVSADGSSWLVALGTSPFAHTPQERIVIITQATFKAATWTPGSLPRAHSYVGFPIALNSTDRLTLFAGQIDPADGSRIIVAYSLNGHPGTIEGFIQNNGYVRMRIREGPAVAAPTRWWEQR
jgi:hypothetical protein